MVLGVLVVTRVPLCMYIYQVCGALVPQIYSPRRRALVFLHLEPILSLRPLGLGAYKLYYGSPIIKGIPRAHVLVTLSSQ